MIVRRKKLLLFSFILLCLSTPAHAQTDPIDPSRRIDWNPGIPGGIPNRTTVCSTLNPGATVTQINSAISSCPSGQVVFLNAGTYNLAGGIDFQSKNNVTLRGAGPDQTLLVFSGSIACEGGSFAASICIRGSTNHAGSIQNQTSWTAGYSKGTTEITLSSTTNITPGQTVLTLDQHNDSSDPGTVYICTEANVCVIQGEAGAERTDLSGCSGDECRRSQHQMVLATAVNGNTVTISPGLYMPNWRSDRVPGVWWPTQVVAGVGIEDLTLDNSNSRQSGVVMWNSYECWVKNVRSLRADRAHVLVILSARTVVRDSYFHLTESTGSQSYGAELRITSDILIENNIFHKITVPIATGGAGGGNVAAYNYTIDNAFSVAAWMIPGLSLHGVSNLWLFEGNDTNQYQGDNVHGTKNFQTVFRNRLSGWEPGKTLQTVPVYIYTFGRYDNIIGNVLGEEGYHNNYEDLAPSGTNAFTSIYTIGWGGNGEDGTLPNDTLAHTTLMRWGNFDIVTDTARFEASDVPFGLSQFANPVPPNQTLPNSYYLSARPPWFDTSFGSVPWPPAGPEVTGGDVPNVGGHAHKIPARLCYENSPKNANGVLTFNADNCYGTALPRPAPPTNLGVVVR